MKVFMDSFSEFLDKMIENMSEDDIDAYVEEKIMEKYLRYVDLE